MKIRNWKTTLCGLAGGAIIAVLPILQTGTFSPRELVIGGIIGALGVLAKDLNVTGGSASES